MCTGGCSETRNITIPKGAKGNPGVGTRGANVSYGSGVPSSTTGRIAGDNYIDSSTGKIYVLTSGAWVDSGQTLKQPVYVLGSVPDSAILLNASNPNVASANGATAHGAGTVATGIGSNTFGVGSKTVQTGEIATASGYYDSKGDVETKHLDLMYKGTFGAEAASIWSGDGNATEAEMLIAGTDRIVLDENNTLYTIDVVASVVKAPTNTGGSKEIYSSKQVYTIHRDNSGVINIENSDELYLYRNGVNFNEGDFQFVLAVESGGELVAMIYRNTGNSPSINIKGHASLRISKVTY